MSNSVSQPEQITLFFPIVKVNLVGCLFVDLCDLGSNGANQRKDTV